MAVPVDYCSCDPLGIADGTNVYAYVHDNPIRLRDAHGTQADTTEAEERAQACLPNPGIVHPPRPWKERSQVSNLNTSRALETLRTFRPNLRSGGRQVLALAARPVDTSGQPLKGPYYLWSDDAKLPGLNRTVAKIEIAANKTGWLMSQTPQHVAAARAFADALRAEAATKFPGVTFSDAQLFDMAGKTLVLLKPQMQAIWDQPSKEVAQAAVLGDIPVQRNLVTPPGPGTVQARVEIPTVQKWGAGMSIIPIAAGGLSIYAGAQEQSDTLAALGITGGALQVGGGALSLAGALRISAPLASAGSQMSLIGAAVTAPVTISHAVDDFKGDDPSRKLIGGLNIAGIVAPPGAFLGAYEEYFVIPAAKRLYETTRGAISQLYGVPIEWVH